MNLEALEAAFRATAEQFRSADGTPADQQSFVAHCKAVESLRASGGDPGDERQYLAAIEVAAGTTAAVAGEVDPLVPGLVVGDALDRLARDELPPDYTGDEYLAAFAEAERRSGVNYGRGGLDDIEAGLV
jgi:hypothetical protein